MTGYGVTGAYSFLNYLYETTYATSASGSAKCLGTDFAITDFTMKNNVEKHFGLNNQEATDQVPLKLQGTLSGTFKLADPWIFAGLSGNAATTSGSGPYTHKWVDTVNGIFLSKQCMSFQLGVNTNTSTAEKRAVAGAVIKSFKMSAKVGESVSCTADFDWATDALTTTLDTYAPPVDNVYTFAYANLEFPTSTTRTVVQNVDLTWNRNPEIEWGLGSRIGQLFVNKTSVYDCSTSIAKVDSSDLSYAYAGTSSATAPSTLMTEQTIRIILNNGAATTSNQQVDLKFSGVLVDELGVPMDVNNLTTSNLKFSIRKLIYCASINNVATMP